MELNRVVTQSMYYPYDSSQDDESSFPNMLTFKHVTIKGGGNKKGFTKYKAWLAIVSTLLNIVLRSERR